MSAYRFSKGDFVEITGSHRESGKRGYVFEAARDDNSCVCVGIDECQLPKTSHPPPIHVAANCLKLIRKHGSSVVTDLGDFMSCEFPCLGMVASSYSRDKIKIKPHSPHGKLPRPPAQDLPGPHRADQVFEDERSADLFGSAYRGDLVIAWLHFFREVHGKDLETAQSQNFVPWMLAKRTPAYVMKVSVWRDSGMVDLGHLIICPHSEAGGMGWYST
jgi:hypothetical protein